jgi:sugar phosphate isomerase/epimerase
VSWIERYAEALTSEAGEPVPYTGSEARVVLRLAREVAHRTERMNAPVAAYVAGRFVEARIRAGDTPEAAALRAFEIAEAILPEAEPEPEG